MKTVLAFLLIGLIFAGCASQRQESRYYDTYQVKGLSGEFDGESAERALIAAVNSGASTESGPRFDQAAKLVRAPLPIMSKRDIDERTFGTVVVDIRFNEQGEVEQTTIIRSTKDSLSTAVLAAVSTWQIVPLMRDGRTRKLIVRQSFEFKTRR